MCGVSRTRSSPATASRPTPATSPRSAARSSSRSCRRAAACGSTMSPRSTPFAASSPRRSAVRPAALAHHRFHRRSALALRSQRTPCRYLTFWRESSHVGRLGEPLRMYTATTRAIQVTVKPQYRPDQSDPAKSQFIWAYQVPHREQGRRGGPVAQPALEDHRWLGRFQEVKGPGRDRQDAAAASRRGVRVHFRHAALDALGLHGGTYQMVSEAGETFDIEIPTFSLDIPTHRDSSTEARRLN